MTVRKPKSEIGRMVYSVARLLPSFLVLASVGAFFGYYVLRIHDNRLGVSIAVPLLVAFGISRILVLSVPHDGSPEGKTVVGISATSKAIAIGGIVIAALVLFLSGSALVLLCSAGVYQAIDMQGAAIVALKWSGVGFASCVCVLLSMSAAVQVARLSVAEWLFSLGGKSAVLFWKALGTPTRIARFFGRPTSPFSHSH